MHIEFFPTANIIAQIGPITLYFYGAMYALSAFFAYFLLQFWAKKRGISVTNENILDLVFFTFISGVLGGRMFYMLVYNFENFITNPLSIFAVWQGGMSIHGGLMGGAIAFIIYCKYKKLPLGKLADIAVVAVALGMALGRLGNFVNGELPGRITESFLGIDFGDGENRHPSQLYAMGKDIVLFIIFSFILWKGFCKKHAGSIFALFLMFYAVFRFTVEFFREPDAQLGFVFSFLSMGQILSVTLFLVGLGVLIGIKKCNNN